MAMGKFQTVVSDETIHPPYNFTIYLLDVLLIGVQDCPTSTHLRATNIFLHVFLFFKLPKPFVSIHGLNISSSFNIKIGHCINHSLDLS